MKPLIFFLISFLLFSNAAIAQISKLKRQQLLAEYDVFYAEQLEFAGKGEPEAQYAVSLMLAIGAGNMRSDAQKSIEWATKSSEQGNIDAKRLLAAHTHFNSSDHRINKGASTGELRNPLGHILRKYRNIDPQKLQNGLIKNFTNALKTADMGYPKSHLQLVEMYYQGLGTERDIVKAASWAYIASASSHSNDEQLFSKVISELNELQRKISESGAESWLKENAILYEETSWVAPADNNPRVLFKTKDYLYEPVPIKYRGYRGGTTTITKPKMRFTPQSDDEIERFTSTLAKAENGDNDAKLELSRLYQKQIGVTYDDVEALRWIKDAADNGHSEAQYLYGSDLINKANYRPTKEDPNEPEIIKYFTMAAEKEHLLAQGLLATSYYYGINITRNYDKSFKWATEAAERGHTTAQFTLSQLYFNGYGVKKDLVKSYKWGVISRQDKRPIRNEYVMSIEEKLSDDQLEDTEILIDEWLVDHGNKSESLMDKFFNILS